MLLSCCFKINYEGIVVKRILMSLFVTPMIYCASLERIKPDENVLKLLTKFHEATSSGYNSKKPNMKNFQQPGRRFVAKMDSFGLDRYFSFKTDEDVEALVEGVRQGGGMKVEWFYYDAAEDIIKIKQIKPGVVLITDETAD